ncbi:prolyl-tRNA synthetase associated domain-containing protein [Candidatus Nomurabacteria bacterium]|nr:prolyl-tRNA synthetase associated domain-containing protein [Candidatus Nomurabacteria bacterium]
MIDVEKYLQKHDIAYTLHEHPAVFTCDQAEQYCGDIPGMACKNLFLKGGKTKKYFLVVLPASKRADLKEIAKVLGENKVSFGSAESLQEKLGLEPGAVSPFGLLNDKNTQVGLVVDREVYDAEVVSFHPNRNTATIEISKEMFHRYLDSLDHVAQIMG